MLETIITMLKNMGEDVDYHIRKIDEEKPVLIITIDDFEGFDNNWSEIMHEYDVAAVDTLKECLEEHCIFNEDDFYSYYYFKEFDVQLGYSSYDI